MNARVLGPQVQRVGDEFEGNVPEVCGSPRAEVGLWVGADLLDERWISVDCWHSWVGVFVRPNE